jgi:polyhydroxyalkanoate synthase subunit PhaC
MKGNSGPTLKGVPIPVLDVFSLQDRTRRFAGNLLEIAGCGPYESTWDPIDCPGFRLRRYTVFAKNSLPILLVPGPIKRPYIFDLLPEVSVVRRLGEAGLAVYLYEWPEGEQEGWNLEASIRSLSRAAELISTKHGAAPVLVGHSLGGTLAAIAGALEPHLVSKLVLIEAPLKFGSRTGALQPIAHSTPGVPPSPVPGSLLNMASVASAPEEFLFGRYADASASLFDRQAMALHVAVIRWTLDEFHPSGRLIQDVVQLLYREDRFVRNELYFARRLVRCDSLAQIPVAAVVDHTSRVVPSSSTLEALRDPSVFVYEPEIGVALQHVGPLVGRRAHTKIWPNIIGWIQGSAPPTVLA